MGMLSRCDHHPSYLVASIEAIPPDSSASPRNSLGGVSLHHSYPEGQGKTQKRAARSKHLRIELVSSGVRYLTRPVHLAVSRCGGGAKPRV